MQQEQTAFQLIQLRSAAGVPYPPVLLKLSTSTSSSSSSSFSEAASQLPASQSSSTVSVLCSATRFVNGRQQLVELHLSQDKVLEAGRTGLQSSRMSIDEIMDEVLGRLRKREYTAEYAHEHSTVKVTLKDLSGLPLKFDFSSAESVRATPAFVLAFEAASAFAEILTTAEKSALEAADALKARDRDLRISERKLQNTQQELSDKRNQYTRLLATGGLGVENAASPGRGTNGRRAPSEMPMEMDDGGPRKKRKAAAPTLTGAGRIVKKKVKTGFIDSDDDDEGSGSEANDDGVLSVASKTTTESASSSDKKAEKDGSALEDQETEKDGHNDREKHKTVKADPSMARNGRTAQKQVDKGFVDDDSATDED